MSNIVPLQSSSPPPLTDDDFNNGEDEDDDEFGNFATASSSFNDFLSPTRNSFKPLNFSSAKNLKATTTITPDPSLSFSPPKIDAPLVDNDNFIPNMPPKIDDSFVTHNGNRTYKNGENTVNNFFISSDKKEIHKEGGGNTTDIASDTFQNTTSTLDNNCDDFEAPSTQDLSSPICDNFPVDDDDDFGSFSTSFPPDITQQLDTQPATIEPNANSCILEEQVPCPTREIELSETKAFTSTEDITDKPSTTTDEPHKKSACEGQVMASNKETFNEGVEIPSEEKGTFNCTFEANFEFKFETEEPEEDDNKAGSDWAIPEKEVDLSDANLDDDDFDDFANFESAETVVTGHLKEVADDKDSNDEFAEFESVSFSSSLTVKEHVESPNDPYKKEFSQTSEDVLENVFPSLSPYSEVTLQPLLEAKSKILLERLKDLDTSPALNFSWPASQAFQLFIKSLCIDGSLVNPSVPLFAAGLGLLEPTPAEAQDDSSPAIPEAHFDWGQSGLVNPLESSALSMLNLDFLTQELNKLREETSPVRQNQTEENFKVPSLLTNLLVTPTHSTSTEKGLSEEAKAIVEQLPDLSFMQASVLMFPVLEAR